MTFGTLTQLLSRRSGTVVWGDERVDDIATRAAAVAAGLRRRGVRHGDSIAFQLGNRVETVALYRACWQLGAVAVAFHHRLGPAERDALVRRTEPRVMVSSPEDVHELEADGEADAAHDASAVEPDDLAVVLFTAGSTGEPKGVRHRHGALAYKTELMVDVHGLTGDDVVLMPAPLSHISGLLNGILVAGAAGMTTVLMDRWSPAQGLELIEREHVSFMVGPPTFFVDLMDDPAFTSERVRSLRLVSSGGAGVAPEFVERASRTLDATVKRSYGSTEAPTVATSTAEDDPERARFFDGHAIGDAELKVVDGELLVRGPELFAGYLSEEQTAGALTEDGWFRTGDLAMITDDGWLGITGRAKEIVIRAGENIAIAEVEQVLEAHPDVARAAVVGVPHDRLGEQVAALVVLTDGASFSVDDCVAWFDERGVARFKTPEIVVAVDALPVSATGKIDRQAAAAIVRDLS